MGCEVEGEEKTGFGAEEVEALGLVEGVGEVVRRDWNGGSGG